MATREQISSQITSLEREVRAMRAQLDMITKALDIQPANDRVLHDDERGTFLPGTGWVSDERTKP